MNVKERYESAKEIYAAIGVDTDKAVETLENIAISMHCWQGDDVTGFDQKGPLTGGIQTTGNYPGKARTPEELMADIDKVFSLVPGKHKLNLHASYAIFEDGEFADRDKIEPKHFKKWVDFAKEKGIGLDFNPTFFSHSKVVDGLTLSSPIDEVRNFWIEHGKACIRISQYFAEELGIPCAMNIWIPDGYKDIPADRLGPRARFKDSWIRSFPSLTINPRFCVPGIQGIRHRTGILHCGVQRIYTSIMRQTTALSALWTTDIIIPQRWYPIKFPPCSCSMTRLRFM